MDHLPGGPSISHPGDLQAFAGETVLAFILVIVIVAVATRTRAVGQGAATAIGGGRWN